MMNISNLEPLRMSPTQGRTMTSQSIIFSLIPHIFCPHLHHACFGKSQLKNLTHTNTAPSMMMMRSRLCIRALRRLAVSPSLSKPLFQLRCNSSSTAPVGKKGPKAFNSLAIQREAQSAARQALLEGTETSILYPRIQQDNYITSFPEILSTCQSLGPGMAVKETTVTIRG